MLIKKFLVQIESDNTTRWHADDAELCQWLNLPVRGAVHAVTTGAKPLITITPEEQRQPVKIQHGMPEQKECLFCGRLSLNSTCGCRPSTLTPA